MPAKVWGPLRHFAVQNVAHGSTGTPAPLLEMPDLRVLESRTTF